MRINYSLQSEEIRAAAVKLLEGFSVDDLNGDLDDNEGYKSLTHGMSPQVENFTDEQQQAQFIIKYLSEIKNTNEVPLGNICIVSRLKRELETIEAELEKSKILFHRILPNSVESGGNSHVKTATMHRVKGLEYEQMIIISVNDGIVPLSKVISDKGDKVEERQADLEERALLYVAMTRATKQVIIASYGKPSLYCS